MKSSSKKERVSFLERIYAGPPALLKSPQMSELLRVYHDLEKTLRALKENAENAALEAIDVRKLILQLSRSKRRLERKIGNTLLLEKQHLKRRFSRLVKT